MSARLELRHLMAPNWRTWLITLGAIATSSWPGCGPLIPARELNVKYDGGAFPTQTSPQKVEVLRATPPNRPYIEMGTVSISCPTSATSGWGFRHTIEIEGGCTFDEAVDQARKALAKVGADGMFGITTAAASNGALVSLIATAFKYQNAPPPAKRATEVVPAQEQPPASPQTPAPSMQERLIQLKALHDNGLITPEEYEKRKAEILKQI